jgi:hypothetical protein
MWWRRCGDRQPHAAVYESQDGRRNCETLFGFLCHRPLAAEHLVSIPVSAARAAFWMAALAVLVLMLLPAEHVQRLPLNFWDKAQHSLAFGVLTLLGLRAWPQQQDRIRLLVGLVIYGGGIELAQHLTGRRHGDWADWAADSAGVAVVAALALARRRRP